MLIIIPYFQKVDLNADLIQKMEYCLGKPVSLILRYIDDVLSLSNPTFGDFIRFYTYRLAQRNLDKGYYRHHEVSLIS